MIKLSAIMLLYRKELSTSDSSVKWHKEYVRNILKYSCTSKTNSFAFFLYNKQHIGQVIQAVVYVKVLDITHVTKVLNIGAKPIIIEEPWKHMFPFPYSD